jgi:hypothetical protein
MPATNGDEQLARIDERTVNIKETVDELKGLVLGFDKRIREVEIEQVRIDERMTIGNRVQVIFTSIASIIATLIGISR